MILLALATAALSAAFCGIYLVIARRRNIVDHPNARSSHLQATPHGGGAPLFLAFALMVLAAFGNGLLSHWHYALALVVALLLLVTGIVDDLRNLAMKLRLTIYAALTLATSALLMGEQFQSSAALGIVFIVLAFLAVLWLLNLYNFMDGIDGIASLQAVGACSVVALLATDVQYSVFCMLLAAAHVGFLLFNRPPAKLFMGDAGSVPTGFLLGCLAIIGSVQGAVDPLIWLVLLAVFITDATWTLIWRVATGQAFTQAHNLHAYQRLSRHWDSHKKVDAVFLLIFCGWLAPIAWLVDYQPDYDLILVIFAYLPLLLGMAKTSALK